MNNKTGSLQKPKLMAVMKNFLIIFLLLAGITGAILAVFYSKQLKVKKLILETNAVNNINLYIEAITNEFNRILSDLMFLSDQNELMELLESNNAANRRALAKEYLAFSARKKTYDQIRFLDENGMEIVRVNFNYGMPAIVPEKKLQIKTDRYYFKDTFKLEQGRVFVSRFDLNIEEGQIEKPLKPVIRFGTPIFDKKGRKRGIVVLNYLGSHLINNFKKISAMDYGRIMLLDSYGFWLYGGPGPEDDWGFMYEDRHDKVFGKLYSEAWKRISKEYEGQFYNSEGFFTFLTINPLLKSLQFYPELLESPEKAISYSWKIVSCISCGGLEAQLHGTLPSYLKLYGAIMLLLGGFSWFLASVLENRKLVWEENKFNRIELDRIFNSASSGMALIDKEFNIRRVNKTLLKYLGLKENEAVGKKCHEILGCMKYMSHDCSIFRIKGGDELVELEYDLKSKRGENTDNIISCIVTATPFQNAKGELVGIIANFLDITERKKREKELLRLSSAVNNSPVCVVITDTDGNIEYVNPKFVELTGYSFKEAIGQNPRILNAKKQPPEHYKELWDTIKSGRIWNGEFCNKKKNGELYWENSFIAPVKDSQGNIINFVAVKEDITERKRIQEELQNEKEFIEVSLNSQKDTFFVFDPFTKKPLRWNKANLEMTGYSDEEIKKMKVPDDYFDEEGRKKAESAVKRILEKGQETVEIPLLKKDGSLIPMEYIASLIKDKDGNPKYIIAVGRDITYRKKVERFRKRYEFIINSVRDLMSFVDRNYVYRAVNNGWCSALELSRDGAIGKTVPEIWGEDTFKEEIKPYIDRCFNGEEVLYEKWMEFKNHEGRRYCQISMIPYKNPEGEVTHAVVVTKDITSKKLSEDVLRIAKSEAERANRAKSDFLSNMSHELRTPLNVIIGFSEVIRDGLTGQVTKEQKEYLDDILSSSKHLLSLINDILDLSKIEAGKIELEYSEFSLRNLLEKSLVLFKEKALKHKIKTSLNVSDDVTIEADERRIKQVVFNLLSNAYKFTPDEGKVVMESKKKDGEVEISVSDTGIGIQKEHLDRLFSPFERLEMTLTKQFEGTGLGLSICRKIIELHDGKIWVESEGKGRGSKFVFTIPIKGKTDG